jgi:Penicillin binding protein transpeptidase domain/Penicillin-binding Protein dimerisation domain
VVRVGAVVNEVSDPAATAEGLARVLDVDAGPLLRQLRGGGPEQFVEALVLRDEDYAALRPSLASVPDVTTVETTAPLAPTREFARALLGAVAPVTAEQLQRLGSDYAIGDQVGQWGLQARFERRLAGRATRRVVVRSRGLPVETLFERAGKRGRPLSTTLDTRVQLAAEGALGDRDDEAALVAVDPGSGDVLAVANRPVDSSFNRALEGRYPPGSTFKVISTAAVLRAGLDIDETVDCPRTLVVGGKLFRNFEGSAAGAVPFSEDFAESCNTAFVSLASRLDRYALSRAARDFGLGRRLRLPVDAPAAQVPPGRTEVERAAAMIGQHELLASPLSMAGVAATVAAGRWHAPRLFKSARRAEGPALADAERDTLAGLMRSVVTSGTGQALEGVAGEPAGKSGTAEFGGGSPPPTHAWFIAYRDDVAVAVLVENGRSGGSVAAPIAAQFFAVLDARGSVLDARAKVEPRAKECRPVRPSQRNGRCGYVGAERNSGSSGRPASSAAKLSSARLRVAGGAAGSPPPLRPTRTGLAPRSLELCRRFHSLFPFVEVAVRLASRRRRRAAPHGDVSRAVRRGHHQRLMLLLKGERPQTRHPVRRGSGHPIVGGRCSAARRRGARAASGHSSGLHWPEDVAVGVADGGRQAAATDVATGSFTGASHANPSGSVKGPASLPITSRCDPAPSGETPASFARARRL